MLGKLKRLVKSAFRGRPAPVKKQTFRKLEADLRAAGINKAEWILKIRESRLLYCDLAPEQISRVREDYPAICAETLRIADKALKREFNFLGSGPYTAVPPDGGVIDWNLDPVRALRFPPRVYHKDWNLATMKPGNADVKFPWEISRCQHFAALGQAYRLTGDERYAKEIETQIHDFTKANPAGYGVVWTCTMDVALRALNWVVGLGFIRECPAISDESFFETLDAVYVHGQFIETNLENFYEVTSNHYLSNLAGLYFVSRLFNGLSAGAGWEKFCRDELEKEIEKQISNDGSDYESSVPYHRLVLELFLGPARLADFYGKPFSAGYSRKLESMAGFLAAVTRPDGLMPQFGDADDGRMTIFRGFGEWNPQDGRSVLAPAALMLGNHEWLAMSGDGGGWEAAWWGFGDYISKGAEPQAASLKSFPDAGIFVYRDQGDYLAVTNGIVGTNGFGNHKHNDLLGFEFHSGGVPVIVDPGSYVYTSDPAARNLFRGTSYHNTLKIDGVDQNEINPEWLFRMFEKAAPETLYFREDDSAVEYSGRHFGYKRLENPVTHTRFIKFLKKEKALLVFDILDGSAVHEVQWHFHFAPGVKVGLLADGGYRVSASGSCFDFRCSPGLSGAASAARYSPSYGVAVPCVALDFSAKVELNGKTSWFFILSPSGADTAGLFADAMDEMIKSLPR